MKREFGRLHAPDDRDSEYLIRKTSTRRTFRYWYQGGWKGDQQMTPHCVGYSWVHWLEDGPVTHKQTPPPMVQPEKIYHAAQKCDEWEGEAYEGTSVRAGAKVLKELGWISEYRWAFDVGALINAVLTQGPVVVGTNWYGGMLEPNVDNILSVSGYSLGGHAYLINGVNTRRELFRMKNSWGPDWGQGGSAFIPFSGMEQLIKEDGEVCLAKEVA